MIYYDFVGPGSSWKASIAAIRRPCRPRHRPQFTAGANITDTAIMANVVRFPLAGRSCPTSAAARHCFVNASALNASVEHAVRLSGHDRRGLRSTRTGASMSGHTSARLTRRSTTVHRRHLNNNNISLMASIQYKPVSAPPLPPPPPPVVSPPSFMVFFDWDRSNFRSRR